MPVSESKSQVELLHQISNIVSSGLTLEKMLEELIGLAEAGGTGLAAVREIYRAAWQQREALESKDSEPMPELTEAQPPRPHHPPPRTSAYQLSALQPRHR